MSGKRVSRSRTCDLQECDEIYFSSGYCSKHYQRWRSTGDPRKVRLMSRKNTTDLERFLSKINKAGGYVDFSDPMVIAKPEDGQCWIPRLSPVGRKRLYTQFSVAGKLIYSHRFAYLIWVGNIPPKMTVDHRCRNTRCVNPKHLDCVTMKENVERRDGRSEQQLGK